MDIAALLIAYLVGSLPFAYLVARWRGGADIRRVGEGNAGARNVYHVVGRRWGVLVGVLDIAKGWAAYHISRALGVSDGAILLTGFAVVLGHTFPFLRWRQGGKGVAATMGFLLGLLPRSTALGMAISLLALAFLRDVNRVLIIACLTIVLLPLAFGEPLLTSVYVVALMLVMATKKILDRPHEQRVWAERGWTDGATPGFAAEGSPVGAVGEEGRASPSTS